MQNNGLRELIVFMECDGLHIREGKVLTASIAAKFRAFSCSFHLTISSKSSATEKEADASKVTKINIRFTPGKELKEAIAKAQLHNVKTMAEKNKKKKP